MCHKKQNHPQLFYGIDSPVSCGEMHKIADEYSLTGREVEVFTYPLTPKTADEIADELLIAPSKGRHLKIPVEISYVFDRFFLF